MYLLKSNSGLNTTLHISRVKHLDYERKIRNKVTVIWHKNIGVLG